MNEDGKPVLCDCGSGWYSIIRDLCAEIREICRKAGVEPDIIIDQIKEKSGTLRFYWHREENDPEIHAIDFMDGGGIRFHAGGSDLNRSLDDAVTRAEKRSKDVCEGCGKPGTLRTDHFWVLTLCDDCHKKHNEGKL